ncbi:hypothetical protein IWX92DRAFT_173261 [Phyllosticta citricarpa]
MPIYFPLGLSTCTTAFRLRLLPSRQRPLSAPPAVVFFPSSRFRYHSTCFSFFPIRQSPLLSPHISPHGRRKNCALRQQLLHTSSNRLLDCAKSFKPPNMSFTNESVASISSISPVFTRASTTESPLTSPDGSNFDVTDIDSALVDCLVRDYDLESVCSILIQVAYRAGDMIVAADPSVDESDTKNNSSDRVTATDKAVEAMIYESLKAAFPSFDFLGEETFKEGQKLTDAPTFVVDPVDGTLNFIHGFPNVAISLALTIARQPVVGVIYNPFRRDLFTAVKGKGAHLTRFDGRKMALPIKKTPAPLTSLNDCLVAVEWGNQRHGSNWDLRTSVHKKLLSSKDGGGAMVHSVRSNGSAALDFCYVAAGWFDAFWEAGVWIWDVCAGCVILSEAGGMLVSANPGDWSPDLEGRCYFAVRGAPSDGQRKIVDELWGLMDGKSFTYPVRK